MSAPLKPWESNSLQNNSQILKNENQQNGIMTGNLRSAPVLPPRPQTNIGAVSGLGLGNTYYNNSYAPYSGYGGLSYGSYGSYPYRSSMYSGAGGYGMYGMGGYSAFNNQDDTERRFIQFAEERSRNTFANIENVVRAVNSLAMMLDNTFFAITSSFRAVLSVAEHFGRLRSVFGHIWYSINIFRLLSWFYKRVLRLMGRNVTSSGSSLAWKEATSGIAVKESSGSTSSWSTVAFLGVLMSAPYLLSKLLPKYNDTSKQENWKSPGIKAKAAFDFTATGQNEMSFRVNDEILLAPTSIQEEMKLMNTGWAFAVCNSKSGVVPLNYLVLVNNPSSSSENRYVPIPRPSTSTNKKQPLKSNLKKVSFGENQIIHPEDLDSSKINFENVDKSNADNSAQKLGEHLKEPVDHPSEVDNNNSDGNAV